MAQAKFHMMHIQNASKLGENDSLGFKIALKRATSSPRENSLMILRFSCHPLMVLLSPYGNKLQR